MLELTDEECRDLEKRVVEQIRAAHPDKESIKNTIQELAVRSVILTIREYERMKD